MADVAKNYGVGDTVYVHYIGSIQNQFIPVSRVVSKVNINTSSNEALVHFEYGNPVIDGAVVTVYDSQALCAAGIVTWVITQSAAAVALDATLSVASTVSQASSTLGRVS